MTLLLGPPGAGKTTLLKALAGKLSHSNLHVSHYLITVSLIELALTPNFALLTVAR